VLAGLKPTPFKSALGGVAAFPFKEEFFTFTPA